MVSLQKILKNADERVKVACAKALNDASKQLEEQIKNNMTAQGINNRTGRLRASVTATKATVKRPTVIVKSEVYAKLPKNANKNRRLWGKGNIKYPAKGVPYGRILEFSPRFNRAFFYPAWYKMRKQIREEVINAIGDAWSNG